jgi:hypothetical protein
MISGIPCNWEEVALGLAIDEASLKYLPGHSDFTNKETNTLRYLPNNSRLNMP